MRSTATVAVVGAGPSGAIAGLRLSRMGLKVLLIDPAVERHRDVTETLSPRGRSILSLAGLWDKRPEGAAIACPTMTRVWEDGRPTSRSFLTNPYGCAWHVDRSRLDAWLAAEALDAGAELVSSTVTGVWPAESRWVCQVRTADGEKDRLAADFLVVATGRVQLRASLGRRTRLDALCLVGGFSEMAPGEDARLVVEATPDGWWYSAPSADGRLFTGWMTDASTLKGKRRDEVTEIALAKAPLTRARLASSFEPRCVAVISSMLMPCAGDGWIAVGDAALAQDPLSGEGLAHALRSGWEAAETIQSALQGDSSAWQEAATRGAALAAQYRSRRLHAYREVLHRWPHQRFWADRVSASREQSVNNSLPNTRESEATVGG